jgi:hypothetical protein
VAAAAEGLGSGELPKEMLSSSVKAEAELGALRGEAASKVSSP